jgi:ATP-binding protein involved in chromosome partitioning
VVVTTPQEVALDDVRRGVEMLQKMEIPVVGVVENMSYFICPGCGDKAHIFGKGGASKLTQEASLELLGQVPLDISAMEASEEGTPIVITQPDSPITREYKKIAHAIWSSLNREA